MRRIIAWVAVAALTVVMTAVSIRQAIERYEALNSGWSWDLAYYNQWYWALTQGDQVVTVRPASPYGDEGPSVWKMNYLAPIRFMLVPFYLLYPDPRTLLVIHSVIFWCVIPASFTLVKSETKSHAVALAATALVPATPLLWPLASNDFRELQMALPFVLWAIQGYRGRDGWLTALGIGGMLACRQEYALIVASFALLPPREKEDVGRTYLWAQMALMLGLCWILFAFFGYMKWFVASTAPELYVQQFGGQKAPLGQTLATAWDFLVVGLGSWAILACFAPRVALLSLPWLWNLSSGRWALRYLATEHWHHVRYTAPFVAVGLAAGLIGFARLANWANQRRAGRELLRGAWFTAALAMVPSQWELQARFSRAQPAIARAEASEIWRWIRQVRPDESVLAVYEVTAPLSSRSRLYSYILQVNKPPGFPNLSPDFRWVFLRNGDFQPQILLDQGFELVYTGSFLSIFHRPDRHSPPNPKK